MQDLVLVGTYTDPSRQAGFEVTPATPVMGMTGTTGSAGIYVFRRDVETGRLDLVGTAPAVNPSFLARNRAARIVFAVNEVRDIGTAGAGGATAFALDRDSGSLRLLNEVPTAGGNPCHLSLSRDERFLMVANHEAGSVAVLPVRRKGASPTSSTSGPTSRRATAERTRIS